jgi:hypothetical protein
MIAAPRTTLRTQTANFVLALLSLGATVAVIEVGFRVARFDFEFKQRAIDRTPIFFRQPQVSMGDGLFRREGPARWEGRVLTPMLERHRVPERFHPHEPPRVIEYDRDGFRNPPGLADWEIAVAGDSFTELGHLPEDALFTTGLSVALGLRVRNLGVSYTGPWSQVAYLQRFGRAASLRHAVLAFFEGNDLADVVREDRQRRAARARAAQGLAPVDERARLTALEPQSSFLLALRRAIASLPSKREPLLPNAHFAGAEGPVPVTVTYTPASLAELPRGVRQQLGAALDAWARAARAAGAEPWMLFLPTKRRVLDGRLDFEPETPEPLRRWAPNPLPEEIRELARARGIRFIDATPALAGEAARGRLPYEAVWDTHLDRLGAAIVARVLEEALREGESARSAPAAGALPSESGLP